MSNAIKPKMAMLRRFRVGIVGGSSETFQVLQRIFSVTGFRARAYEAVHIAPDATTLPKALDILLMASLNPRVMARWDGPLVQGVHRLRPFIRLLGKPPAQGANLSEPSRPELGDYLLEAPINPSKLLKMLDDYTIRELHFLPEFEIGQTSSRVGAPTLAHLAQLPRGSDGLVARRPGLNKALVVDVSLSVRRQMELEFGLYGAGVVQAATAEAALGETLNTAFDIIFMDVILPGLDGYTACRQIKKTAANKNTPLVLLTTRASPIDRMKGALAGCDAYLTKPITHNQFEAVIQQHFPIQ